MNTYILVVDSDQVQHYFFQEVIDNNQLPYRRLTSLNLNAGLKVLRVVKPSNVFIQVKKSELSILKSLRKLIRREKFPGVIFNFYGEPEMGAFDMQGDIISIQSTRQMERSLRNYLKLQLEINHKNELRTLIARRG